MAVLATDARAGAMGHGECSGSVESELVEICKLRFFGEEEAVFARGSSTVDGKAEPFRRRGAEDDNYIIN